ncbi:MAG: hypothetical protein AB1487_08605 [Thermodesulfobacteriota bacterium]
MSNNFGKPVAFYDKVSIAGFKKIKTSGKIMLPASELPRNEKGRWELTSPKCNYYLRPQVEPEADGCKQ